MKIMNIKDINDINDIDPELLVGICDVITKNGIVAFPSDTVYGLMAKVSPESILKIDKIKGRLPGKNYALILDNVESLNHLLKVDDETKSIISKNSPGLFTFVVKPKEILDDRIRLLISKEGTLGLRIPKSELMRAVASKELVLATSANLSGQPSVYSFSDLKTQLGDKVKNIDLIIDCQTEPKTLASTVIDLTISPPKILRQGNGLLAI